MVYAIETNQRQVLPANAGRTVVNPAPSYTFGTGTTTGPTPSTNLSFGNTVSNALNSFSAWVSPNSSTGWNMGTPVTGATVATSSPATGAQVVTAQVDGGTGTFGNILSSLGAVMQSIGQPAEVEYTPVSYDTGGSGGVSPAVMIVGACAVGALAYALTR